MNIKKKVTPATGTLGVPADNSQTPGTPEPAVNTALTAPATGTPIPAGSPGAPANNSPTTITPGAPANNSPAPSTPETTITTGTPEPAPVNPQLREYVESAIIPLYDSFDKGHQRDHVRYVIAEALRLSSFYDVDRDIIYAAAAFHDTGLCEDRKTHHIVSARIIRADSRLPEWFTSAQIETIADAAEDHRASSDHEPRTIYGKIIAEADRQIIPETVIRRTIQYGLKHYPELDAEGHWRRTIDHLHEKYAEGGYLRLWIPESPNATRLEELRTLIRDESTLRTLFDSLFPTLRV